MTAYTNIKLFIIITKIGKLMRTLFLLVCLSIALASCANLLIPKQNLQIIKRNLAIANLVIDAQERMLTDSFPAAILVYTSDESFQQENITIFLGNNTYSILGKNASHIDHISNSVCMTFYRVDIPAAPEIKPCFENLAIIENIKENSKQILKNRTFIRDNERRISKNQRDILKLEKVIDFNVGATLETFKLSATTSNVTVAQNEFFEEVRKEAKELDERLAAMEQAQNGFQRNIRSQLATMGIKLDQLVSVANEIRN